MVSAKLFLDRWRSVSCTSAQMRHCHLGYLWMCTAADSEPHCWRVSVNKIVKQWLYRVEDDKLCWAETLTTDLTVVAEQSTHVHSSGKDHNHSLTDALTGLKQNGTYMADSDTRRRLRSSSSNKLVVPRTRLKTVGDRAFGLSLIHIWRCRRRG